MIKTLQKIIYVISIISFILLTTITIEMLPIIFQAQWQGIVYLILVFIILIIELITLINHKDLLKNSFIYNLFIILITMYVSIIYYKIYNVNFSSTYTYDIDIYYCKDNYILLSIALLLVIIYLIIYIIDTTKKEKM